MNYASSWQDYSFGGLRLTPVLPTFRKAFLSIHDHFIPHERNNYHPHILGHRLLGLVSLLMVAMKFAIIVAAAVGPSAMVYSSAITTSNVLSLTNESRQDYNLPVLAFNDKLAQAAQAKANDMAAKGYFSHTTPDGHSPWWFIQNAGYSYIAAGENLAVDFTQAESVETAWMNSPGHRANILNSSFEEIGIGIASGQFQGHNTTFVVQMFGTPVAQQIAFQSQPTPVAQAAPAPAPVPTPAPAPVAAAPVPTPAPATVAPVQPAPRSTVVKSVTVDQIKAASPLALREPGTQVAAAETPTEVPADLRILDTSTAIAGDQLIVYVTTAGPATKVVADYNGAAVLLDPKSDTVWQGVIPLAKFSGETNLTVTASDMQGHNQQAGVASFSPSTQSNYHFLGNVKGAAINLFGTTIDPKAFEQKFYLIIVAGLLTCMILAIAIKRHIQHLSLVANSSFVAALAMLLWMAG